MLLTIAAASLAAPFALAQSEASPPEIVRCGCGHHASLDPSSLQAYAGTAACGAAFNVDDMAFDPANRPLYRISIVFHLVGTDTTPSAVTQARVDTQMQILNDAFEDAQIEFFTADVRRYNNSNWAVDVGDYWTSTSSTPAGT